MLHYVKFIILCFFFRNRNSVHPTPTTRYTSAYPFTLSWTTVALVHGGRVSSKLVLLRCVKNYRYSALWPVWAETRAECVPGCIIYTYIYIYICNIYCIYNLCIVKGIRT